MFLLVESSLPLAIKCSPSLLESHFVPLLDELRERAISLWQDEQYLSGIRKQGDHQSLERQEALVEVCVCAGGEVVCVRGETVGATWNCKAPILLTNYTK